MRPADQLSQFVREALIAGRSRDEIARALSEAGWTESEVREALDTWVAGAFLPPVPRPRPFLSAREAFVYGLMFLALATTAWHLVSLSFNMIDRCFPDPAQIERSYADLSGMRFSIASLVVFLPLFLFLNQRTNAATQADPGKRRSLVRKWFGYITLFLASIALLGDLIAVVFALLNGDLTLRFAAKAAVVAAVAGAVFFYFRGELDDEETR